MERFALLTLKDLSSAKIQCIIFTKGIYIIVTVLYHGTELVDCICIAILFKLNNALCKWKQTPMWGLIFSCNKRVFFLFTNGITLFIYMEKNSETRKMQSQIHISLCVASSTPLLSFDGYRKKGKTSFHPKDILVLVEFLTAHKNNSYRWIFIEIPRQNSWTLLHVRS